MIRSVLAALLAVALCGAAQAHGTHVTHGHFSRTIVFTPSFSYGAAYGAAFVPGYLPLYVPAPVEVVPTTPAVPVTPTAPATDPVPQPAYGAALQAVPVVQAVPYASAFAVRQVVVRQPVFVTRSRVVIINGRAVRQFFRVRVR